MSSLQRLLVNYERQVSLPLIERLPAVQRVWFVVYAPEQERRLRFLLPEFELRTRRHGRGWHAIDTTDFAARFVGSHEYRDEFLRDPGLLDREAAQEAVALEVAQQLRTCEAGSSSIVALYGLAGLFGFANVSALVSSIQDLVEGRLVCFFPGSRDQHSYHFMNAREGWNYHALPITDEEGFLHP